jgi:15-cis-phytoene synthase
MSRDTSFYYSFLVLPPRKRSAVIAVWDFCRAVDDTVDEAEPADERRAVEELAVWRSEVAACYDPARSPSTPQGQALKPVIRDFDLPRGPFDDLIRGVEMDLQHVRYPTFEALADYCRHVASTVGLICVEIFGYRDARARSYAVNLGMALQLTNIVRDVAADLQRGRIYLPAEDLERFRVTEQALRQGRMTGAVRALMRYQCERAHDYFRRAAADLPPADVRSLVAAEIMGGIYFGILQRIEHAGYDVFSRRIRVPRPQRAVIALRIWLRTLLIRPRAQDPRSKTQC